LLGRERAWAEVGDGLQGEMAEEGMNREDSKDMKEERE
jgi:hypothetical protein